MGQFLKTTIVRGDEGAIVRHDIDDAEAFSTTEKCPTISVDVHDGSILTFTLYLDGKQVDSYNSCPGYFDDSDTTPSGGDAAVLATEFNRKEYETRIEDILRFDSINGDDEDRYVFATERLSDLIEALGGDPNKLEVEENVG